MASTIPASARKLIEDWRLGFVASADAAGRVNLSPKGTFAVIDETTIGFAEMRSPNTLANIAVRPEVEVNFVNMLTRKGVRIRGDARVAGRGGADFDGLLPHFAAHWSDIADMFNAFVLIAVREVKPLQSPVYETGETEAGLSATWLEKIKGFAT